jgi:putative transposase
MVAKVRAGASMRAVARLHRVSLSTVQWWVQRAGDLPLDKVDWGNRSPIPARSARTAAVVEDLVLMLRRELKERSALGEYGARAIHSELVARRHAAVPSLRTIGRILERRGALDGGRRIRRNPPPAGWYLPEVAAGRAELDSFDIVEGLALEGGVRVEVLNAVSLRGGLPGAWPQRLVTAKTTVQALLQHWRDFGLPAYAQFDNDTIFQGSHSGRDSLGRVIRTCLQLGVTPVFAPPQEPGFQAAIENFNGRWQAKVWSRFHYNSLADLQAQSRRYIRAYRQRAAARIDDAPKRRPLPLPWQPNLQAHPPGSGNLHTSHLRSRRGQPAWTYL